MNSNYFFDTILKLYDNLIINVNVNEKVVNKVINADKEIGFNLSYMEFSELFGKIIDLNSKSIEKVYRFLNNLNLSDEPFSVNAKYEKN